MSVLIRFVVMVAALVVVPVPRADAHCGPVTVFGRVAVFGANGRAMAFTPGFDMRGAACVAGADGDSTHAIYPGSNAVSIRFTGDMGSGSLSATLSGLGLDRTVTLERTDVIGIPTYDSRVLPLDPLQRGTLTVSVAGATETYRTAG